MRLSKDDAYRFIYENSSHNTVLYENQWKLRKEAFHCRPSTGQIFEFGVFKGRSTNFFAKLLKESGDSRKIYGFDSFRGFSETWTGVEEEFPSSRFDQKGNQPKVEKNVELIDGYIEETLPKFVADFKVDSVAFIHIDTDTYSPAKTVLSTLKPYFQPGTIIVFDESVGYPNWRSHEYQALSETLTPSSHEFLGFSVGARRINLMNSAIRCI